MKKTDISLIEIFRILMRRKYVILGMILLSLIAAILYNLFKDPVYESSVLLKKEIIVENKEPDRIQNILALRSQDVLDTEMELVQTRKVLNSVINDLSLNVLIKNITEQDGTVTPINLPLPEYQHNFAIGKYNRSFPKINSLNIGLITKKYSFRITNSKDGELSIKGQNKEDIFKSKTNYSNLLPKD